MQFFLYEIVARIVAIYLCVDCCRAIRDGFVERKINYSNTDFLDQLISDWSDRFAHRDVAPVSYWILIGLQVTAFLACLVVAIFGWLQP